MNRIRWRIPSDWKDRSRFYLARTLRATLFGALIGAFVSVAVSTAIIRPRFEFVGEIVQVIGLSGLIVGAACGLLIGLVPHTDTALILGGIVGVIGACCLSWLGFLWYYGTPWPSPKVYPSTDVEASYHGPIGSYGLSRTYEYVIDMPLPHIQQYYEQEMSKYCVDNWEFTELDAENLSYCIQSRCDVLRRGMGQFFNLRLCPISDTQVEVKHVDTWED